MKRKKRKDKEQEPAPQPQYQQPQYPQQPNQQYYQQQQQYQNSYYPQQQQPQYQQYQYPQQQPYQQQPQYQQPPQQPPQQPKPKKEKMGIEAKIANMDPKLKKLYTQIITVMLLLLILYAVMSIVFTVVLNGAPFMTWFNTADFTTVVVGVVFLGIMYKMISGGSISVPDELSSKGQGQKKEFNFPDTYGVKKQKSLLMTQPLQQQPQQTYQPPQTQSTQQGTGSWRCPNCNAIVIGSPSVCNRCGYQR